MAILCTARILLEGHAAFFMGSPKGIFNFPFVGSRRLDFIVVQSEYMQALVLQGPRKIPLSFV